MRRREFIRLFSSTVRHGLASGIASSGIGSGTLIVPPIPMGPAEQDRCAGIMSKKRKAGH
jgi:hypothetical protein